MQAIDNVLLLGGTGFLGSATCEALIERFGAARLVVASRRPARAKHLLPLPGLELAAADVHDDAALARVVAGRSAVVNLVGILHGDAADFERAHVALPRRLARECAAAGVRRVVHVSALSVAPDAPSNYLRSKAGGEAALRGAAGLDLTLLRPSVIFGAGDRFLNTFAQLQRVFPVVPLASAEARFQPVWVEDVAAAIVRCLEDDTTVGQTYELAGPRVYTLAELVRLAGRWSGHERPVFRLPESLGRLQATLMGLVPGEPLLSADNLDSMRVPNVASGTLPGLPALGITPAALEAVGPSYLDVHRGIGRLDTLRAVARRR